MTRKLVVEGWDIAEDGQRLNGYFFRLREDAVDFNSRRAFPGKVVRVRQTTEIIEPKRRKKP